jgi:hypothetical protein
MPPSVRIQVRRWSGGRLEDRITIKGYGRAEEFIHRLIDEGKEPIYSWRFVLTTTGARGIEYRVPKQKRLADALDS